MLRLAIRNLRRNKRRTLLTTLSIAVSFLIFSVLVSLPLVIDTITNTKPSSMRIICHNQAGLTDSLPVAYNPTSKQFRMWSRLLA